MNYRTVHQELLKEIPELKPFIDKEVKRWRGYGPLQNNLFSDVFNPYLINLLAINEDRELLNRIFDFLEKMITCDDFLVQQLVESTVLERLGADKTTLTKSQKYMGKETKKMSYEVGLMNYSTVDDEKTILTQSPKYMGKETKKLSYEVGVMNYNTVDKDLIKEIPELKPFYDKLFDGWAVEGEPGKHVIFGSVLNPYLLNLFEINEDEELLSRIFDFLERMATCSDTKVQDVLGATVLEKLGDNKRILAKSQKYMGKETKIMSYEVEKGWGRI